MNKEQENFIKQISEEARKRNADVVIFGDVDIQNIVVDTSSIEYDTCLEILKKSKKIQVPYVVLEECDKHLKDDETTDKFKFAIREFQDKIIYQPERYKITSLGFRSCEDADNLLINYLYTEPKSVRPTLLTADKNLGLRASALEIGVILYIVENPKYKLKRRIEKQECYSKKNEELEDIIPEEFLQEVQVKNYSNTGIYRKFGFEIAPKEEGVVQIKRYSQDNEIFKRNGNDYTEILLDTEITTEKVPQEFCLIGKTRGGVCCMIMEWTNKEINTKKYEFYSLNELILNKNLSEELKDKIQRFFF